MRSGFVYLGSVPVTLVGHYIKSLTSEESGGSNLWLTDSCGLRGSKWHRALPGGNADQT